MKPAAQKPVDEDNKEEGKQDNVSPTTEDTLAAATAAAEAPKIDHGNIPHGTLQGYDDDSSEDENEKDTWHEKMRLVLCLETDKEIAKQYKLLQMGSYPWLERYEKYYVFVADEVHDFFKLVCNKFNDASWIPSSKAHPTMHPDFEVPRKFPKTKECGDMDYFKCKRILNTMRVKLVWIISNYSSKGNGSVEKHQSSSATRDKQEDSGDDDEEDEVKYGHFDLDLAEREGGDDRKKFLDEIGFTSDVLYWWQFLFDIDMLQATCGIMNRELGVSSMEKYVSIASLDRKRKARRQRKRSRSEI